MHIGRKSLQHFSRNIVGQDATLVALENLRIMQAHTNGLQFTDKRLVFLYDPNRKQFDPFLISDTDYSPLIGSMKPVPVDITEPILFTEISTIPLHYYEKYKKYRYLDDLTNTQQSIIAAVKSKELVNFSFYLSPEDLFISHTLQKGKLFRANWLTRPRINLDELRLLNRSFLQRFGKNLPFLSLHLANILMKGSTLIMTDRSKRSIKTSSSLSKIERMFFWFSVPGDGMYKIFSEEDPNGKNFDLSTEEQIIHSLTHEILRKQQPNNTVYYLDPSLRKEFLDLYYQIKDFTGNPLELEFINKPPIDSRRQHLPGRRNIKHTFDAVFIEVNENKKEYEDFYNCISFSGQAETPNLDKVGSKQIRRNLLMLYRWLSLLETARKINGDNSTFRYRIRKCKFLIYTNILIFKSGNLLSHKNMPPS